MPDNITIAEIKDKLVHSCLNFDTKSFIPFLLSDKVKTHYDSKVKFYHPFKMFIKWCKESSLTELTLKIEHFEEKDNYISYNMNFYDETYEYPRILIEIKETKNSIYIHILPF